MTTDFANIQFDCFNDADFRAWGLRLSQMLATCGLVQTADTGQINWATITRTPLSNNTDNVHGYEMYRFNDALQATAPVFIKVEYGTQSDYNGYFGNSIFVHPIIYITIGTATNGAGSLTGLLVGTRTRHVGSNVYHYTSSSNANAPQAASTSSPTYGAGGAGWLTLAIGVTAQATPYLGSVSGYARYLGVPAVLAIERTHDAAGVNNGDGLIFASHRWNAAPGGSISSVPTFQVHSFGTYGVGPQDGYVPFAMSGAGFGTANLAGDVSYFPLPVQSPKPQGQALGLVGTFKNDVPLGSVQAITVCGASHNYLSLAGIAGTAAADNTRSRFWDGIPNGAMMMRYE